MNLNRIEIAHACGLTIAQVAHLTADLPSIAARGTGCGGRVRLYTSAAVRGALLAQGRAAAVPAFDAYVVGREEVAA